MLRAILVCATAVGCFSLTALAQPGNPPTDKKTEITKGKDDGKAKAKEKETPKASVEKSRLPKDAIIVVVDNLIEALSQLPGGSVSFKDFMKLKDRLDTLERQLKSDKKIPFSCKLSGKLEGDFLVLRAAYVFSTEVPKTTVVLGLSGGHLLDEGDLDGQTPILDYSKDEGFLAIIEKEGKQHHLTLNFRVPVQVKKSSTLSIERGVELGLPGTPLTALALELPDSVKELRCNDTLEKTKTPPRWQIGLAEKSGKLTLAWKEPVASPGNAPLPKADAQIDVTINEKDVQITADLFLEDSRLQTKDWFLKLPAKATVEEVKAPGSLTWVLDKPGGGTPNYVLRTSDATAERWQVTVTMRVPRPTTKIPVEIGPFHVLGAFQAQGTITVRMKPEVNFGQRLVYLRSDGVYQIKNTETEAVFQYVSEKNLKTLKAPLALVWHPEKNQVETRVSHDLKVRTVNQGWEIETTTEIKMKTLFSGINAIDLKLRQPRPTGVAHLGTVASGLAFPGGLPWGGLWKSFGSPEHAYANADEYVVLDELNTPLKLVPQDAGGKTRVMLERSLGSKPVTLIVKNKIRIPFGTQRLRLELPQPLNTQDRAAKLSIQADDRIELLHGPEGDEEPVPYRNHFEMTWDQSPGFVDLAWRPFLREVVAQSTLDIALHEHTVQVKQSLRFPREQGVGAHITLKLPRGIDKTPELSGGKILQHNLAKQTLLVRPDDADKELVLDYDLAMTPARLLHVTPIWPLSASQMDAKVRVWSASGVKATLTGDQRGSWKERSIEIVPGKEQFPSLVLQGFGANLILSLKIDESAAPAQAAFLADRALIQIRTLDDGGQQCRARYLIRKIHADHVDVELLLPMPRLGNPTFTLSKLQGTEEGKSVNYVLNATPTDKTEMVVRVKLPAGLIALPAVLDINYTIPVEALDRNSFWRTMLYAPIFVSEVMIAEMRWQFTAPTPMIAASLGRNVRADSRWSWQSWLRTPEPSVTSAELESWLTQEPSQSSVPVTYSFAHISLQPETVYHLPRHWWVLGCSGLLLVVTVGGYFSPLPRLVFWLALLVLTLAALTLGILFPAAAPPVLFGSQPGIVLFVVFVGVHWLLQERYRRQLVFLPGFSRAKPGSTMVRTNSAKRPREASTVDAPTAAAAEASASKPGGSAT